MASPIVYSFEPNTIVYVIIPCDLTAIVNTSVSKDIKVSEGKVIRFRAEVILTGETQMYDIQILGSPGTVPVLPTDTFVDLATATTDYELRLAV